MTPLVVHYVDSQEMGGVEHVVLDLLQHQDQARFRSFLACRGAPLADAAAALGVPVMATPDLAPGLAGASRIALLARRLRSVRPDVLHAHLTWPLDAQYALAAARLARVPAVVATAHLFVDVTLGRRVAAQQRLATRLVDRYMAVSAAVRDRLVADLGWPPSKIDVVRNGVPPGVARAAPPLPRQSLAPDGEAIVLVPARLTGQKGQRHLLRAAAGIPGARLVFAGDGPDRPMLEAEAAALGLDGRVVFLGHRSDVPSLLSIADVVVLPSLWEGLPLAVLEAMAAGRPVVATAVGGLREVITPGRDGLLVEPGCPAAIADAVNWLLADPARSLRMGEAARVAVEERFSTARMCAEVAAVYEDALHG